MTGTPGRWEAAHGDAARVWHCLDEVLPKTCECRDALERNGLDKLAEEFGGIVGRVEEAHAEAEKAVAKAMED